MSEKFIPCPFCGEDDFDLYGLKCHLTGEGMLFNNGCKRFIALNDYEYTQEPERHET